MGRKLISGKTSWVGGNPLGKTPLKVERKKEERGWGWSRTPSIGRGLAKGQLDKGGEGGGQ